MTELSQSVLKQLAEADSDLKATYDASRQYWRPDDVPVTIAFGDLGITLAKKFDQQTDPELVTLCTIVEAALKAADEQSDENTGAGVATGFLEAMLHFITRDQYQRLKKFLGDKSLAYCTAYNAFTGHDW